MRKAGNRHEVGPHEPGGRGGELCPEAPEALGLWEAAAGPRRGHCRHQRAAGWRGARCARVCHSGCVAHARTTLQKQERRHRPSETTQSHRPTQRPSAGAPQPPASPSEAPPPGGAESCGQAVRGAASEGPGGRQLSHAYTKWGNPGLLRTGLSVGSTWPPLG